MLITISIAMNCILYVIVGVMAYNNVILMDDKNVPIPKEAEDNYKFFIILLSAIWPVLFIIAAFGQSEETRN